MGWTIRFAVYLRWLVPVVAVQAVLLALIAWWLDGFEIGGPNTVIVAAAIITIGEAIAWPFLYELAARLHPVVLPIATFVASGILIQVTALLVEAFGGHDFIVNDLWTGILISVSLAAGSTLLGVLFSVNDYRAYDRWVTDSLAAVYRGVATRTSPGTMFIEIDGLAKPILEQAIAGGYMPTVARWLSSGSHEVTGWEPDLSSQTSASQAGILLGSNEGIPAFRWWDKERKALIVSSKMATAHLLEERLSSGNGLLANDGASRWNVFSGDAEDCVCTFSTLRTKGRAGSNVYIAQFLNPYALARTIVLFVADVIRERWQAYWQVRRGEEPRIHRSWKYALVRAATASAMLEASRFMLTADMLRGVSSAYYTIFAYDEVAHHSGIDRQDAFKVLAKIDEVIDHVDRLRARTPRPYHIVLLSDHGQSMGATFLQRYGETLEVLVRKLVASDVRVAGALHPDEHIGQVNLALTEAVHADHPTARLLRRSLRKRMSDEGVTIESPAGPLPTDAELAANEIVVLASGNLGLISFTQFDHRLTLEEIISVAPGLVSGLVKHPGVAFVMVKTDDGGGLVIGKQGHYDLTTGLAEGEDPLAGYGPRVARHLAREHGFPNCPDVLVMGAWDEEAGQGMAFEELVGFHGGVGGPQTEPFVLHPRSYKAPSREIVGAADLHQVMKGWMASAAGE